jgi:hypothetical protein
MHDQNEEELIQQNTTQIHVPVVKDIICFGDTSVCIADENDIYIWGRDVTD